MLGQPVYFLTPEVVGVHITGALREGVTATDLALHVTQMLRAQKVVGSSSSFMAKARVVAAAGPREVGNMARNTARRWIFSSRRRVGELSARDWSDRGAMRRVRELFPRQKMFGMPRKGEIDYSVDLELDLADVQPSVAGPKRPQDRVNLPELGSVFRSLLQNR